MLNQAIFSRLLSGFSHEEQPSRPSGHKAIVYKLRGHSAWVAALALLATTGPAGAGLVGLWQFNEGTGQTVSSAVNFLNGYLGNSSANTTYDPAWSASGSPLGGGGGNSLYLSGGSYLRAQVDNTSMLNVTNAITLAIDFSPDSFPQGVLVSKHGGSSNGSYMLSLTPANGYYSFTIINASSTRVNLTWPVPGGSSNAWHQLVGTYDSASGIMKLYYDGIYRTNTTQTGKIKVYPTAPLVFGNYSVLDTAWKYTGYIDNGALFDTALGDGGVAVGQPAAVGSDIYNLYHSGAVSFVPAMLVTNPPASQAVAVGGSATFGVGVSGGAQPLTYQWRLNGVNITGATTNPCTISNIQTTNAGSYTAVVTDANNLSVISPPASLLLTIGHTLVGLWQFDEGADQILHDSSGSGLDGYLGTSASDTTYDATWSTTGSTVGGGGGGALYFPPGQFDIQGRVDTTPLLTPASALTLAADIQWDNSGGTYGVIVSKHSGSTSGSYLLDIANTGTQFEFMVINTSGTRVNLDWTFPPGDTSNGYHQLVGTYDGLMMRLYYDGALVATNAQSGGIQSVTAPFLIGNFNGPTTLWEYTGLIDNVALFSTALGDGGVAVGDAAAAGSDIYKLFHQGAVTFVPPMIITNRPLSQAVAVGATATFNVGASGGAAPLAYRWQLNGTNVASATTTQLTISNAQLTNAGSYTAIVTDSSSLSVTSQPAILLVGTIGHNLVGLWQFDEGTGQIIHDSSGNGLDGYLGLDPSDTVQDAEWSTSGSPLGAAGGTVAPGNNALYFPSGVPGTADDVARVDNTPLLTPANALTLAADIQWNMAGTHGVIVSKHGGSSTGPYLLDVTADNVSFDFMVVTATGGRVDLYWPFPPGDVGGTYHQLVGTYDGLTMRLYYDGVLEATAAQSGQLAVTKFPLLIGDYSQTNVPTPGVWEYEGLIDNVALFSTALSDGGVAVGQPVAAGSDLYKLYQQGAFAFTPPHVTAALGGPNTLVLNWAGTNILDSATNLSGPWIPVTTNASPYNVDVTAKARQFFRCRRL